MPANFELERLKPKLDIFKIHENRVHELTDSNVSLMLRHKFAFVALLISVYQYDVCHEGG